MKIDFSVPSMLPFARSAIRSSSNFEIWQFMDLLFGELHKAGVEGVSLAPRGQGGPPSKYNYTDFGCPPALRQGAAEVFFYLLHRGLILPTPQSFPVAFDTDRYWKTARGAEWANGSAPLPEDAAGYIRVLSGLVPTLNPIIRQYVEEGVSSFSRQLFFSAAVMLGAASEMEIYLLGESLEGALKDAGQQSRLRKLLDGRSLYKLLECVDGHVRTCMASHRNFDGAGLHVLSLFEAVRVERNDAVHPKSASVTEDAVRLSYDAFPHALQKAEELRVWFDVNPASI
jgi:hypothetical protein